MTRTYDARLISALPEPVQRYFRYALKEGAPYVNSARMRHTGEFRLAQNKPWTMIHGEQYFTTETPGFVWRGVTTLLPGDAIKNDPLAKETFDRMLDHLRANAVDVTTVPTVQGPMLTFDPATERFVGGNPALTARANTSLLLKREGRGEFKIPTIKAAVRAT